MPLCRRRVLPCVQFTTCWLSRSPLGITTTAPSYAASTLLRKPIDLMVPPARNLHNVAYIYRLLKSNDQPAHQVIDEGLQAKTDTHAQRAEDQRYFIERNTCCSKGEQQAQTDNDDAHQQEPAADTCPAIMAFCFAKQPVRKQKKETILETITDRERIRKKETTLQILKLKSPTDLCRKRNS